MKWLLILLLLAIALLWWRGSAFANRDLPKAGDSAPDFTLPDQNGKVRRLAEFAKRWLVLYFFPRADTPG